jgi:hypothetical protein
MFIAIWSLAAKMFSLYYLVPDGTNVLLIHLVPGGNIFSLYHYFPGGTNVLLIHLVSGGKNVLLIHYAPGGTNPINVRPLWGRFKQ